jgi:uncharacterized protein
MLSDEQLARLDELLSDANPDDSMVPEEVDGFFAALACCPAPVPGDEYLPVVLGLPTDALVGTSPELLKLLERHWASVAAQLYEGEGFTPVLTHDDEGRAGGNAWAVGFVRGMAMRPDAWDALDDDEDFADALDPVMRLVEEVQRDEDDDAGEADETVEPIGDEERKELLADMFNGVMDVYQFFQEERERNLAPAPARRETAKVGRNDPCPCGSGRKYKQCHGAARPN